MANNGKGALRIAESTNPPDIILLDIMMPDMDGYEVIKKLKEMPSTRDIPVIFITAMDQVENEEYGLSLGAIDYIIKPYSPPLVKARVRNHLELKRYRDILKKFSMLDGLTGIPNRRHFDEIFAREWGRAVRNGSSLSLVLIDIDFFKNYNDTYGHLTGDECLIKVAEELQNITQRPTDFVARWGGEEFACLLPDTEQEGAVKIAETLRKRIIELKIPHETSLIADIVTVSLGVATVVPAIETNPQLLAQKADEALYKAKRTGRNKVSY